MKTPLMSLFGAIVALLLGACATEAADTHANALAHIRANYYALSAGFAVHDQAAILALRADDFHADTPDGRTQDAAEMRRGLAGFLTLNPGPIQSRFTMLCSRFPSEDEALIVFQEVSRTQTISETAHQVDTNVTQRERWRRTAQGWRFASVDQVSLNHRWIDGKQVQPGIPYDPAAAPYVPPAPSATTCEQRLAAPDHAAIN